VYLVGITTEKLILCYQSVYSKQCRWKPKQSY